MNLVYPKKKYKCGYCGKHTIRPYYFVDGYKSCQKCNREYLGETVELKKVASCPTCEGKGYLEVTRTIQP